MMKVHRVATWTHEPATSSALAAIQCAGIEELVGDHTGLLVRQPPVAVDGEALGPVP
jgi:hypothetical protein